MAVADAPEITIEPMFTPLPDGRFMPSPLSRAGWSPNMVSGGLPAALLARAIERAHGDGGLQLSRLTVDLFRPAPRTPLEVVAREVRVGRRIAVYDASVIADGVEVTRASGLLLRRSETPATARDMPPLATPESLEPDAFPGAAEDRAEGRAGFATEIELRWASRGGDGTPPTAWIRIPFPIVEGEETTPLMRAAAIADFANRMSQVARSRQTALGRVPGGGTGFINADVTLYLHRDPVDEWLAITAFDGGSTMGIGTADIVLSDRGGVFGHAGQGQLAN